MIFTYAYKNLTYMYTNFRGVVIATKLKPHKKLTNLRYIVKLYVALWEFFALIFSCVKF